MADMTDIETAFPDIQTNLSNPEPRCPVVLLLDVSASMQGEKIRALNEGVAQLSHYLRQDRLLSLRVEIAIVAAGEETLVLDCQGGQAVYPTGDAFVLAEDFTPPPLQAHGVRKLGEGMRLALKLLRDRKDELRALGDVCYCPRILLVSDGAPNDDGWEQAADAAVSEERRREVVVHPVGVEGADMAALSRFSIRRPLKLRGVDFPALFEFPELESILAPDSPDYNRRYDEMRERPAEQPLTTDVSLAENPEPRCPVVLLLDTSDSMGGEGIRALNSAVATFNHNLHADQLASLRIEIALVAVGGTARVLDVRGRGGVVEPTGDAFAPVDSFVPPTLEADGLTPLGEGMRLALRLLRSRKDELRAQALHLFRPWILLISDGAPNDYGWEHAADAAKDEERRNGVSVYPVGVKDANMTCLARFSTRPPLKLRGYDFESLFRWLSDSLQITSGSRPGEVVQLPHPAWTETTA